MELNDWPALVSVLSQSFNTPSTGWETFRDRIGAESFYVATEQAQVIGGLAVYALGQFFNGARVPLGGIAGVGVAPHARGRGVARALVVASMRDMRQRGTPMAGLYPASLQVYRSCGFEQAGERVQFQVDLSVLAPAKLEVAVQPVDCSSVEAFSAIRARYQPTHGNLDRSDAIWSRIRMPYSGVRRAWLIGNDGYVVLSQTPEDSPHYDLDIVDVCAPSPATQRTMWALLAGHRSLANNARWFGGSADSLLALVPEPRWTVPQHQRWMLRVTDVDAALLARGWPVDGEVHLDIDDPLLPENSGRRVLRVRGGQPSISPGGSGLLTLNIRALGPLYSGMFRAETLAQLGWISGAAEEVAAAGRLFASPVPWMREMY